MKRYILGNHYGTQNFECLQCAYKAYSELQGKKSLLDKSNNKLIANNYGWKNET
jgi:hypothetical protein